MTPPRQDLAEGALWSPVPGGAGSGLATPCSWHLGSLHPTSSPGTPGLLLGWGDAEPWVQVGARCSLTPSSPGVPVGPVGAGGAGCQHERPRPWGAQAHHLLVSPGARWVSTGQRKERTGTVTSPFGAGQLRALVLNRVGGGGEGSFGDSQAGRAGPGMTMPLYPSPEQAEEPAAGEVWAPAPRRGGRGGAGALHAAYPGGGAHRHRLLHLQGRQRVWHQAVRGQAGGQR